MAEVPPAPRHVDPGLAWCLLAARWRGLLTEANRRALPPQSDLVNGSGVVRGYEVWEAKSGERLFLIFGYTIPPYPEGKDFVPFEGTFEWIGGTGGLQNLRGKGTIEGEVSRRGETHYRWAGSYERATAK